MFTSLTWHVPSTGTSVILGNPGAGKSTLLKTLSGRPPELGVVVSGSWQRDDGSSLLERSAAPWQHDVAWLPQIKHAPVGPFEEPERCDAAWRRVQAALNGDAKVVLLDEPTRGLRDEDVQRVIDSSRGASTAKSIVLVTHDVAFASRVADRYALIVEGQLIHVAPTADPRGLDPMARELLRTGRYALPMSAEEDVVTLPSHFRWVLPGRLAGMGAPGLLREVEEDLYSVWQAGIRVLVTLTETPFEASMLYPFGIASLHLPIPDMGVPSVDDALRTCIRVDRYLSEEEAVAVHCRAGLGRTGTILACLLVLRGMTDEESITRVRQAIRGAVQTEVQRRFVTRFRERVVGACGA